MQYTMKWDNTRQRPVVILNNGLIEAAGQV